MTWLGCARQTHDECGSTNDLALAWARAGAPHGALVTAEAQTAGRGRFGRTWVSPRGRSIYLSIVVRVGSVPAPPLTLAVGVGVCDALRAEGVAAGLKWPNDVLCDHRGGWRKLAGVLCEATSDAVVIGIGVNCNGTADELGPEVAARAATIGEVLGRWVDRDAFLERLLASLGPWIDRYLARGLPAIVDAWQARQVAGLVVHTDRGRGVASGIDRDGALIFTADDGVVHRVTAGEVEWIP